MWMKNKIIFDIETTGLNAWYGHQITCICAKATGINGDAESYFSFASADEKKILQDFLEWIKRFPKHELITKNGKAFDIPFILTRCVMLEMEEIPYYLLSMKHFDLHEITDRWVSLNDMAKLFNCVEKSGKGKDAIDLFVNYNLKELEEYCMQDVVVTNDVYKIFQELKKGKQGND